MQPLNYLIVLPTLISTITSTQVNLPEINVNDVAVTKLQDYVKIHSEQPTPNYSATTQFITNYANELNLPVEVVNCKPNKPIVIIKWQGTGTGKSIVLNSHTDVVPVTTSKWDDDPFSAILKKDQFGDDIVVGRGTQDTKALGIEYLEAIRKLMKSNFKPKRTVYVLFSPDEEIGGTDGIACFVNTPKFLELDVGFVWDEGLAKQQDVFTIYYTEKYQWRFEAVAIGDTGHAAFFVKNLATTKLHKFHSHIMDYRYSQEKQVVSGKKKDGDVTSINLTIMKGGSVINTVPDSASYTYDVRVSPLTNLTRFDYNLQKWAKQANITINYLTRGSPDVTDLTKDPWFYKSIKQAAAKLNITLQLEIYPGGSDGRHIRKFQIPVLGLSPHRNLTYRAHDHNEFIKIKNLNEGIDFLMEALKNLTEGV